MIANFGYKDGSGDFYIIIDTEKCNGCGDCVAPCPAGLLEIRDNEYDPLADNPMAVVKEEFRKKKKLFFRKSFKLIEPNLVYLIC